MGLVYAIFIYFCSFLYYYHVSDNKNTEGKMIGLGDNCIQNFYLGRYIVGYTVGNLLGQYEMAC